MQVYLQRCMKNDKCFLPVIHRRAYTDSAVYLRNRHNSGGTVQLGLQFTKRHQGPTRMGKVRTFYYYLRFSRRREYTLLLRMSLYIPNILVPYLLDGLGQWRVPTSECPSFLGRPKSLLPLGLKRKQNLFSNYYILHPVRVRNPPLPVT
jgi:hypothetical protein